MSAAYVSQGYPLLAEQGGRRYLVIGWEVSPALGHALPLVVPAATGCTSKRAYVEDEKFTFSTPEPARELVAELNAVLDRFEDGGNYGGSGDQSLDLVHTLRALLASWST